ncbi:HKD family nuclease [Novosphingobium chloroacetimidivorans]|uniref:HKD family nuclease n=1 Tax=Novosphingobium chloroacetimidivorans TaxID=1428314 RepID=A0A7W7NXB9_9SPHN|nr:phospholipase D family protein [Novosphingobium chloroacetimidivorans]MBB4859279.1 HKD family nuclease [Novosphingobium chloroacetimidivorans]
MQDHTEERVASADSAAPRLVRNENERDHLAAIEDIMHGATRISFAVAFLKSKGLGRVIGTLTARLENAADVEAFVGSDFCLTEPGALKDLLDLSRRYPQLEVFVAKADARSTFHPKIFLGVGATGAQLMVGSANLTGGAVTQNEEVSVILGLEEKSPLLAEMRSVFSEYRTNPRFEELDEVVLEIYRARFKVAEEAKRRLETELAAGDASAFDLDKLSLLHAEFRRDKAEMKALRKRRRDRKLAMTVQRQIAGMSRTKSLARRDRDEFANLFRDLITSGDGHRHLWHSGDIHRRGQEAITQPRETIALFAAAEAASQKPPEEGYAEIRRLGGEISGVGINMVSEILCTFAPKRYAVYNGNTAAALRALGASPPKSVTLFSAESYARVCGVIEAVRRRIGGEDLSDADAFLNWIYQTKVKPDTKR